MAISTISRTEVERDYAAAEDAAHAGPVFITENGTPQAVLLDIADYRKLAGESVSPVRAGNGSLVDLLAVPEDEYFEWNPPRLRMHLGPEAD